MDFVRNLLGTEEKKEKPSKHEKEAVPPPIKLLVLQSDKYDWAEIFKGHTLRNGAKVLVEQAGWHEILVAAYTHSGQPTVVHIQKRSNKPATTFLPDFVLVRNEVSTPEADYSAQLFGLMYAGVPSVNSLQSIYMFCQRPIVHAELNKINRRLGEEQFPVIPQNYFSKHSAMMYTLPFPAVAKVGHAHAGFGKMRIQNHHDMDDFRTVVAMTKTYCTAEPYIEGSYDLRIQKIGPRIRVFKRTSVSGAWKTNTGSSHLESIPLTDEYQRWAEEASHMFGGLDILTVDVLHSEKTGKEVILEVNGTSSGLSPETEAEDNEDIRDLVLAKMNALFVR